MWGAMDRGLHGRVAIRTRKVGLHGKVGYTQGGLQGVRAPTARVLVTDVVDFN
jgi:hypothetical protein